MDNVFTLVGDTFYSVEQLEAIDAAYGEGFLALNPHFPGEGEYIYADGTISSPHPVTTAERREMFGVSDLSNFGL